MALRHRSMRPKDVSDCVAIVASHPVIGPRYKGVTGDLRQALLQLLEHEAKTAVVFEEEGGSSVKILGMGLSVFVNDTFMRELKTPPFFWIGPELAKRIARGNSPVLSDEQLREANLREGLNLVTWEGCVRAEDIKRADVYNKVMSTYMEGHRGYRWKEIIGVQAETAERFLGVIKSGGMLLDPRRGEWTDSFTGEPEEIVKNPHVIGLSRDIEVRRPGSLVGMLFDYDPPKFGFRPSEQRLLLAALRGGTDEELAKELNVSLSAVKKTWRAIYDRVSAEMPQLAPAPVLDDSVAQDRGKEKKQRLTAYLRDHPEELRPVSRSLRGKDKDPAPRRAHC